MWSFRSAHTYTAPILSTVHILSQYCLYTVHHIQSILSIYCLHRKSSSFWSWPLFPSLRQVPTMTYTQTPRGETVFSASLHDLKWQHSFAVIQWCSPTQKQSAYTVNTFPYAITNKHTLFTEGWKPGRSKRCWSESFYVASNLCQNTSAGVQKWVIT